MQLNISHTPPPPLFNGSKSFPSHKIFKSEPSLFINSFTILAAPSLNIILTTTYMYVQFYVCTLDSKHICTVLRVYTVLKTYMYSLRVYTVLFTYMYSLRVYTVL